MNHPSTNPPSSGGPPSASASARTALRSSVVAAFNGRYPLCNCLPSSQLPFLFSSLLLLPPPASYRHLLLFFFPLQLLLSLIDHGWCISRLIKAPRASPEVTVLNAHSS
ncbi:uncharacterized protein BDR25DRAFT_37675 [Lindgomyces ingoldianus]|uniref:Uncharacterized protein n=1 Tax=Lindgomyces ingoldianus TaxID=673940 RepID=A0ACB6QTJ6_9PLEO|nr:uncharacterized protein BDR25DRAFT_37675 [Lindgomyces ingoldianus]KAF2470177.1 hypothetical protein BDR25DRAFT_37675 [Lindgomyces ingoldianus]